MPTAIRSHTTLERGLIALLGFLLILAALLSRTVGIHFDENNYMAWAMRRPLGDAAETGKPYAFYLLNYALYHLDPQWAGAWRPLSLHVLYAALGVCSIAWLAGKVAATTPAFAWHFVILLSAPFFVFNSTQLMMETPILPLLALTMGGLLDFDRQKRGAVVIVFVSATCAVLLKETAAPALLILLAAFWPRHGKRLWPLALALVVGFGLTAGMLWAVDARPHGYGGVSAFLDFSTVWSRLNRTSRYAWMWAFYIGPFTLLAVLFLYARRGMLRQPDERLLLRLGGLSFLATFLMQLASGPPFARYAYPVVWLGLIAFAFLLLRGPRWLAAVTIALSCLLSSNLWAANSNRLSLWPRLVANEAHYSGYTILPGVPNFGWIAFAGDRRMDVCIFVPDRNSERSWLIREYFGVVTVRPRFFDDTGFEAFQRCPGPKAVVRRQYQPTPAACAPECPASEYSIGVCALQEMRVFSDHGGQILTNRTCLP